MSVSPCLRVFFCSHGAAELQRVALGVAKDEQAAVLQQPGEVLVVEHLLGERLGTLVDVFVAVGRVGQDEVEFSPAADAVGPARRTRPWF